MKQLTVAVPAYNAERSLSQCLDSLCTAAEELEVIIINDGSTDRTGAIALDYVRRYPSTVRVIDQAKSGHGACVNAALDVAAGRYFKVVNAEDQVSPESLQRVLAQLDSIDADVLLTGYQSINPQSRVVQLFLPFSNSSGRQIDIIKLLDKYNDVNSCLEFPGMCVRTEALRSAGLRLSEQTCYDDLEYLILPFSFAETFFILPEPFYVCNEDGALREESPEICEQRARDFQTVTEGLVQTYLSKKPMGQARDAVLSRRIARAVTSLYATLLVKLPDRKEGRKRAAAFRQFLKEADPRLVKLSDKKYKMFRRIGGFHLAPLAYEKMFASPAYVKFKKYWVR